MRDHEDTGLCDGLKLLSRKADSVSGLLGMCEGRLPCSSQHKESLGSDGWRRMCHVGSHSLMTRPRQYAHFNICISCFVSVFIYLSFLSFGVLKIDFGGKP